MTREEHMAMVAAVKESVQIMVENLIDLDEDPPPAAFGVHSGFFSGAERFLIVAQGQDMDVGNPIHKEILLTEAAPAAVIENSGVPFLAFVSAAWMLRAKDLSNPEEIKTTRPSAHPERVEVVGVAAASQAGLSFSSAEMIRPEGAEHPSLGGWDEAPFDQPDAQTGGLIPKLLMRGVEKIALAYAANREWGATR
jgi:hypothetical protein